MLDEYFHRFLPFVLSCVIFLEVLFDESAAEVKHEISRE